MKIFDHPCFPFGLITTGEALKKYVESEQIFMDSIFYEGKDFTGQAALDLFSEARLTEEERFVVTRQNDRTADFLYIGGMTRGKWKFPDVYITINVYTHIEAE